MNTHNSPTQARRGPRCSSRHPLHKQVRCEERAGHLEEQRPHFHSFYMRSWDEIDEQRRPEWVRRAQAGQLVRKDYSEAVRS